MNVEETMNYVYAQKIAELEIKNMDYEIEIENYKNGTTVGLVDKPEYKKERIKSFNNSIEFNKRMIEKLKLKIKGD